jgi:transcriptional regulator with XRE-family HTH domain
MQKTIYSPAYRSMITHLRWIRVHRGLRQEDVGCRLGVSRHWIQKVETCQVRLDVLRFVLLCQVYRADASRIICRLAKKGLPAEGTPFFTCSMAAAAIHCRFRRPHTLRPGALLSGAGFTITAATQPFPLPFPHRRVPYRHQNGNSQTAR